MAAAPSPDASGHRAVLAEQAVDYLVTDPGGIYLDATFGRGGHARLILQRLASAGRLIAFDRDAAAVAAAASICDPRFHIEHTVFSRLAEILASLGIGGIHGVLLDIGVSSPQIDAAERGFSWRGDGPLDMRMDATRGQTAAQWLQCAPIDELTEVIRNYGEERFASSIAKAIVARREAGRPVATTGDLAAVVAGAIPRKSRADGAQHPATRTFQAVRIHVNQELEELALALEQSVQVLATGGRLVVISFHSLEDRIVKRFIDAHAHPDRAAPGARALPLRASELPAPRLAAIARVRADAAEVAANPRARSAVMRVAERTAAAWPGAAR
jgi:16S rRNA (cytosine1402-N4)-methyltransferase